MKKRVRIVLIAALLLCAAAFGLIYTRPLTLEQRYPVLDLSRCVQIRGYYDDGTGVEDAQFVIQPDSPHFDRMVELFQSAAFRTRLRNLFPKGTKTHQYSDGDFRWIVTFRFEQMLLPGGDIGSGDMLHISNFFGDLELSFDGETVSCSLSDQEQWLNEVMSIITQDSGE